MLTVKGHRILIKPDPPKEQVKIPDALKASGFKVEMDADLERRTAAGTEVGTLMGIGPTAWIAYDGNSERWEPWAKIGDRVTFARYSGKIVEDPVTNEKFMVLNDVDMQCVITGEYDSLGEKND